ncbi:MAG: HEAT repeat domain-containing protein [Deltaproteobacteria bacterium]|nr:HEAT repeat domain-containing protein [Deltaproteobacteria bacterium]
MSRALAVIAACLLLCVRAVAADTVQTNVTQLSSSASYKIRLAAALALSKSKDARAVIALADALQNDRDATIRRVSALALEKMIDARTADDARELGLIALETAAAKDRDTKVVTTAKASLKALAGLKRKKGNTSKKPPVFVNIDGTIDQSKKLGKDSTLRVMNIVKTSVERTGYATSWPGGLPTNAELSSSRSRAFIVASTVKKIDITRAGGSTQIACTVAIRVAPWSGKDGGEKWEANKAASASGSAKATTGSRDRDIQGGVRDCVEAVAEDVTSRQVVPFLKRIAQAR